MNMANVKEIQIPNTLYRQLDYINFSGTEYILTEDKPTNNRYYYLNYSLNSIVNDRFIFAANGDSNSNGTFRVTIRTSTTAAQSRYGRNSSSNTSIGTVSINVIYQNRLRIFNDFSAYFATYNTVTSSVIGNTNMSVNIFNPTNMSNFAIMGYNSGGTVGNLTSGKVYRYFYRIGGTSGDLGCDCLPAQRKSDNVCGLYDTINNIFLPMQGTNITTSAAGNIVDENPNWSPKIKKIEDSNGTVLWAKYKITFNTGNFHTTLVNGLQRVVRRNKKANGTKFVADAIDDTLGATGSTINAYSSDVTQMVSCLTGTEMATLLSIINGTYTGTATEITLGKSPYSCANGWYGYIIFPGLIDTGIFIAQWRGVAITSSATAAAIVSTYNSDAIGGQWIYKSDNNTWIIRESNNSDRYLNIYQNTSTTNYNYVYNAASKGGGNYANLCSNKDLSGTYELVFNNAGLII